MSDPVVHSRKRAVLEATVAILVGVIVALTFSRHLGVVICCVGTFVLVSGLFFPAAYRGFKKLGLLLGKVVGVGMAWLLLLPFFYICFTTGRLLLLVTRKDPMNRGFPTDLPTYWVPRGPGRGVASYGHQY